LNQPVKQPTSQEIAFAANTAYDKAGNNAFFENGFTAGVEFVLNYNQPVTFTPQRPAKEEAERVYFRYYNELYMLDSRKISTAKALAIIDIQNTITALQLRGLSTQYEEEVLTILKGM